MLQLMVEAVRKISGSNTTYRGSYTISDGVNRKRVYLPTQPDAPCARLAALSAGLRSIEPGTPITLSGPDGRPLVPATSAHPEFAALRAEIQDLTAQHQVTWKVAEASTPAPTVEKPKAKKPRAKKAAPATEMPPPWTEAPHVTDWWND
jgi:hypothetical protein